VAIDPENGVIYVVDRVNELIRTYSPNGTLLEQWEADTSFAPHSISVGGGGTVYVSEQENDRISVFSSNGSVLLQWGEKGSGAGQFRGPDDIAVDRDGNVYVADSNNHRIQKFTSDGKYVSEWGTRGTGEGQLFWPRGVAVDMNGDVYVADTDNGRVQKFSPDGTFLATWGTYGSGDGQFRGPLGIAVDADGNVYVADTDNCRIQKFSPAVRPGFSIDRSTGCAPLTVAFSDASIGVPTSWLWTFGDGSTSTEQHPQHTYAEIGNYTVTLTINGGTEACTRVNCIKVTPLLFGDANGDDAVDQADTLRVLREVVGLKSRPVNGTEHFRKTDVDGNGVVEVGDALFIAQYNVGLRDVWFARV